MPQPSLTLLVGVAAERPALQNQAAELAQALTLPLTRPDDSRFAYLLVKTAQRLELRTQGSNPPGPIYAEFVSGPAAYRRRFGGGRSQPIARAVGLKGGANPSVLDPTAGLGRDAFVLACLGCTVQMVERSPLIAALLRDGLDRAVVDPQIGPLVTQRLSLTVAEGCAYMEQLNDEQRPEAVYLDPMYPQRSQTALVKKEMRILRQIVDEDDDAPALLACALRCARNRVIVKRPRLAPVVEGPKPSMTLEAKNTRFDVYDSWNLNRDQGNFISGRESTL